MDDEKAFTMLDRIAEGIAPRTEALEVSEQLLDNYFSEKFDIVRTRRALQLMGLDRVFVNKKSQDRVAVDYVHNLSGESEVFLEIMVGHMPGIMTYSLCQIMAIHIAHKHLIIWVDFMKLKRQMYIWKRNKVYPLSRKAEAVGLNVPYEDIRKLGKEFDVSDA